MLLRFLIVGLTVAVTTIASGSSHAWDPQTAVADAERDIATSHIRFCYIGGIVPHPPGIPDEAYRKVAHYDHIEVGSQTCIQDATFSTRNDYARLYNLRMLRYVSHHR